jgi:DMSO/TMAO reductase YedYZ molybdopterin-dependent catalytic subunit
LGLLAGVAIAICFITGFLSHAIQHPPGWFYWPSRPVNLYRVTQGLHVATGLASIPLVGAKLWSVYPKLFRWPPARDLVHALERLSVFVLVAGVLFQLTTGVLNISRWYDPMPFFFTTAHYWAAWLTVGALLVHIAVKLPIVRRALAKPSREPATGGGLSRRGLLAVVGGTAGLITIATVGQTVAPLSRLSVLAPRRPDIGPQGLPVNKSAAAAGVLNQLADAGYRLTVRGPVRSVSLSLADLAALPQHTVALPIACVEGWSATASWTGVRIRDLVALVAPDLAAPEVLVSSLQRGSRYGQSTLPTAHVRDELSLLALRVNGEPLHPDHGYPARLIAPNRPGVLQTKWVSALQVRPS